MTGVTSKFCEERSVSQKFTRELVSFNFPVTTKNVQQSINLCLISGKIFPSAPLHSCRVFQ